MLPKCSISSSIQGLDIKLIIVSYGIILKRVAPNDDIQKGKIGFVVI